MMRDLLTGLKLNDTDHSRHSATKSCLRNGMALTDLEDCYGAIFFIIVDYDTLHSKPLRTLFKYNYKYM